MPARTIVVAVCATIAATALAGCRGSEDASAPLVVPAMATSTKPQPFAELTARELLDDAVTDMREAGAMTWDESTPDGDYTVTSSTSGTCTIAGEVDGSESFRIVRTAGGASTYLNGNEDYWYDNSDDDGGTAAEKFAGKWVTVPPRLSVGLDHFCKLDRVLDHMTSGLGRGTLRRDVAITLDGGVRAIPVIHTVSGRMNSVYVSTGSTPYVVKTEIGEQAVVYSDFGKQPHVTVPPHPLTVRPGDLGDGGGTFQV